MNRTRLLFVVESGTDVRLVEGLAENFDLTVIARKIEGGVEISQPPSAQFPLAIGPASRAGFARFVFTELLRRRSKTDLVVVQGYSLAALAANMARQITGKPTIMLVCSPIEAYYRCRLNHPAGRPYQRHEAALLNFLARANALAGDQYVVLSRYLESVVRSHGARSIHNIPIYGVDTHLFCPPALSKPALKSSLGLPPSGMLIFFSSRVAPEKDSETLLRAMRRLLDDGQDLWLLHRSGGYRQFLADAEKFGVASHVIATDAVHPHHDLPFDYQACDVCVQASREEGLGFSPLEALACETPVIATQVGGLKETILDGQTGWTYPVGDDQKLAQCLASVISQPAEAARRAQAGRQLVISRFDRKLVLRHFVSLCNTHVTDNSGNAFAAIRRNKEGVNVAGSLASKKTLPETNHLTSPPRVFDVRIGLPPTEAAGDNSGTMADSLDSSSAALADEFYSTTTAHQSLYDSQPRRIDPATPSASPLNVVFAVHVARDIQTAVYKNTRQRVEYLESLGHHCTVLTPDDFPWINLSKRRFVPLLYPVAVAHWLMSNRDRIDVAIFHSYAGWVSTFIRKYFGALKKLRMGIVFHGLEPLYFARLAREMKDSVQGLSWRYRLLHGNLMLKFLRSSTRTADLLICLNSQEARYIVENEWADPARVAVTSNPAPSSFFIHRDYRTRATKLLFVGQWLRMKGTHYLVEAFTRLHRQNPALTLCCAGTHQIEKCVLDSFPADIRNSVTVFPRVTEQQLLDLHRDADIFVFPTLSEGSSLALNEAMASGLPIITTPVGTAPDLLRHGNSALLVPAGNSDALSNSAALLLDDVVYRQRLGRHAQLSAESMRPELAWQEFGVCFQLLTRTLKTSDNGAQLFTAGAGT